MVKKLSYTALLASLSLIMFLIENALPPLLPAVAPGVKIGLGNIFVFLALIMLGKVEGLSVLLAKCFLGSLITGNLFAILYSLPSGLMSYALMMLLYCVFGAKISLVAISVASSMVFNAVQIIVACFVTSTLAIIYYLPYVVLVGSVAGFFTGLVVFFVSKNIAKRIVLSL